MDYLFANLGENKVNQTIQAHVAWEQSIEYCYPPPADSNFFADILKRRPKSLSSNSLDSLRSHAIESPNKPRRGNAMQPTPTSNPMDSLMYIICYIKDPSISVHSPATLPRVLSDYRKTLMADDASFEVKKLSRAQKHEVLAALGSGMPLLATSAVVTYFVNHLATNIYVYDEQKKVLNKYTGTTDDTIVIVCDNSTYTLFTVDDAHVFSQDDAKQHLLKRKWVDAAFVGTLSVVELRILADCLGVDTYRLTDCGKRVKLLKEELKTNLLNKI